MGLANLRNLYQYVSDKQVQVTETDNLFTVKIPLL
jgi:hypothetical protein